MKFYDITDDDDDDEDDEDDNSYDEEEEVAVEFGSSWSRPRQRSEPDGPQEEKVDGRECWKWC